jgi:hypothetical protein
MNRFTAALLFLLLPCSTFAYGPRGHRLVGAIADLRLATDQKASEKVSKLLDGLTLATAAGLADSIKGWDDCDRPAGQYSVAGGPRINAELRAFVKANPCKGNPDHHEFHYTDVPVTGNETYKSGKIGRSEYDIVHMIAFCIRVLGNKEPQPNPRAITKTVAVILLSHYLGDIHQPLHVGAEYFDDNGLPIEPSDKVKWHGDQGGNKLNLFTYLDTGKPKAMGGFHSYWDSKVVEAAFGDTPDAQVAAELAKQEPTGWKLKGNPDELAQKMADEIMPIAVEAHRRLEYSKVRISGDGDIEAGRAAEKEHGTYATWSEGIVRTEIQKAGWRLAAILSAVLK